MTGTTPITEAEFRVLNASRWAYAYQPPADLVDTANDLIARGLMFQRADFPACLEITNDGIRAWEEELGRREPSE